VSFPGKAGFIDWVKEDCMVFASSRTVKLASAEVLHITSKFGFAFRPEDGLDLVANNLSAKCSLKKSTCAFIYKFAFIWAFSFQSKRVVVAQSHLNDLEVIGCFDESVNMDSYLDFLLWLQCCILSRIANWQTRLEPGWIKNTLYVCP